MGKICAILIVATHCDGEKRLLGCIHLFLSRKKGFRCAKYCVFLLVATLKKRFSDTQNTWFFLLVATVIKRFSMFKIHDFSLVATLGVMPC